MNKQHTTVYLGHRIDDPHEQHFLERLRGDLDARGTPALILANFLAGRHFRQIDFLVARPHRVAHVELKVFPSPVIGGVNGPWRQVNPDGSEREIGEVNPFRQAQDGSYGISDDMEWLARSDPSVPRHTTRKFFKGIDTVVCLYPAIPTGSRIERFDYVSVVGYDDLLERLSRPGPTIPWGRAEWHAFIRQKNLYRPDERSREERARDQAREIVSDYRRFFLSMHSGRVAPHVPVSALVNGELRKNADLAALALTDRCTVVLGRSGFGKTHLAVDAATQLAGAGHLPLWVRCGEYVPGHLDVLLRRSVAPFTTETPDEMIEAALSTGSVPVIVFDGTNECPPALQPELLEEISALTLAKPVHVVITAQAMPGLPTPMLPVTVELQLPGDEERYAILSAYGVSTDTSMFDAFATPFELSIAAECGLRLPAGAPRADVLDAYIRARAGDEATRAGLRIVAGLMARELRSVVPVGTALETLRRHRPRLGPTTLDAVRTSPLANVGADTIAFAHEQLARFLAAEELVLAAPSGTDLGHLLNEPRHADLRMDAFALERDAERLQAAARVLEHADVFVAAMHGELGALAKTVLIAETEALLNEAIFLSDPIMVSLDVSNFLPRWRQHVPWTAPRRALLKAVGEVLPDGLFIEQTAALFDRTDALMLSSVQERREQGAKHPIADVVAATCGLVLDPQPDDLASAHVLSSIEHLGLTYRDARGAGLANAFHAMYTGTTRTSWTRLFAALHLVNPKDPRCAALLPELLRAAWDAGGYHLRLDALHRVRMLAHRLDDGTREQLVAVLRSLEPDNWALSTSLVEALAAYDAIEPFSTLEELREHVTCMLQESEQPERWAEARQFVASQLEEDVLGPYMEAVEELAPPERAALLLMALRGTRTDEQRWNGMTNHFVLQEFLKTGDLEDPRAQEALIDMASRFVDTGGFQQFVVACHFDALEACARFADTAPPFLVAGDAPNIEAWRDLRLLTFCLARGGQYRPENAALWERLRQETPAAAIDVLSEMWSAAITRVDYGDSAHGRLVAAYPNEIRLLLEWGLQHRDQLRRAHRGGDGGYLVWMLRKVGDEATATLLERYVGDPDVGQAAVQAIRAIRRTDARSA